MDMLAGSSETERVQLERNKRIKIAYLFHDEDSSYFDSFYRKHLAILRRRDKISDNLPDVPAGAPFQEHMKPLFEEAHAIILFLSSGVESDEDRGSPEMIALIEACHEKGTHIWKIAARHYHLEGSIFREYGNFLGKSKVVAAGSGSSDEVLGQIVVEIDNEVTQMLAEEWVQDGDTYYQKMLLDEASAAYDHSLYYVPDYPPALLGKWYVFRKRGMLEEAKLYLEKLLSQDTSTLQNGKGAQSSSSQQLSIVHTYCKGCALLKLGKISEARITFQEVRQRITSPMNKVQKRLCAKAYCSEGDTFLGEGHWAPDFKSYYEQALNAYQKARSLNREEPAYLTRISETYVAFGEAYDVLGDRVRVSDYCWKALDVYQQIIRSYHDYPPAFVVQGDACYLLHHLNEALNAYEMALRFDQCNAHAHGGKGYVLLALNNPQDALQAFEQALFIENNNARYHYSKGQVLTLLKRYQEALEAYDKARDCDLHQSGTFLIHYARVHVEIGDAEYMYGKQDSTSDHYTKARDSYECALKLGGSEKDIYYGYGKICLAYKNWDMALFWYKKALSLYPSMGEAYLGLGKTYLELGNDERAFDCFKSASNLHQRSNSTMDEADVETAYGDTWYRIAERPDAKDHYDDYLEEAQLHYKKAVSIREHAMAYAGLGKICAELHRDKEAIDALNRALELMPQLVKCKFIKGRCYYNLGQYADAYAMYEEAYQTGLNEIDLQKARGEVLLAMKRYKEAMQVFDEIIVRTYEYTNKDVLYAYCGKGTALHGQEKDVEAIQAFFQAYDFDHSVCWERQYRNLLEEIYYNFQKKLSNNTRDARAYKHKGDVLLLLHDRNKEALEAYTSAIDHGNLSVDTLCCRGCVYERLQDYQNAFDDYDEALKLDPSNRWARKRQERIAPMIVQPETGVLQKFISLFRLLANRFSIR